MTLCHLRGAVLANRSDWANSNTGTVRDFEIFYPKLKKSRWVIKSCW